MPISESKSKGIQSKGNPSVNDLDLKRLKGVGPAMVEKLNKLGIQSITDLFFHLPFRYEDRSQITPIASLRNGMRAVVEASITSSAVQYGRRRSLLCRVKDNTGSLTVRFFYFSGAQQKQLKNGTAIRCFGEVSLGKQGLTMIHPEYELDPSALDPNANFTPIYPSTEGLHQTRWRNYIQQAFALARNTKLSDLINANEYPPELDTTHPLYEALYQLHFPKSSADIDLLMDGCHPAQRRLAFEELVAFRLAYARLKQKSRQQPAPKLPLRNTLVEPFIASLPFNLTSAQKKVAQEVCLDMRTEQAMIRLVQGDVGSGKTIVAAMAALQCIENGFQAALMAPTEILAEQHYLNFKDWLETAGSLDTQNELEILVSAMPAPDKRKALENIASGHCKLVIGTHALVQEAVDFCNLGLAIIDEQHRFGVEQRKTLVNKRNDGRTVHQLVMTATPIPRTLAMTFYANMDYSVIDELPPGRTPVTTVVLSAEKRDAVIARISAACVEGRQVYWVCTLVEESELLSAQAAETTFDNLCKSLPNVSIGLVHGRLKPADKQKIMDNFKRGSIQLLVATTVIEVGVDVPNASLMIIENAERLGLSQLHQLRGRVGRGSIESHCVLMYQTPITQNGRARLEIMRSTNDGFEIAEEDLRIRGPGEVMGTKQSGGLSLRVANLERDARMLNDVNTACQRIQHDLPRCDALISRWCTHVDDYSTI